MYYVPNAKHPSAHNTFDTTVSRMYTYTSWNSSISSNTITSTAYHYNILNRGTHKKVASHLSTNINILSRNNLLQIDTTHSPVIKLIAYHHNQKRQIASSKAKVTNLLQSRINDKVSKYHNDR